MKFEYNDIKELIGKIFIFEDLDGNLEPIHEITIEEYENLIRLTHELYEFRYFQRKAIEIQLNYDEYFSTISNYEDELLSLNEEDRQNLLDFAFININRIFNNFLSSFRTFLEHFEMRLKRRYGKESDEVKSFKLFTSNNYDRMFAHKLFIHLRNYSQHEDFPIYHVDYDMDFKNGKAIKCELSAYFNKEKLIESRVGNKIQQDLHLMNYKFPVKHQMLEIQKFINALINEIVKIDFSRLEKNAEAIIFYHTKTFKRRNAKFGFIEIKNEAPIFSLTNLEIKASHFLLQKMNELNLR